MLTEICWSETQDGSYAYQLLLFSLLSQSYERCMRALDPARYLRLHTKTGQCKLCISLIKGSAEQLIVDKRDWPEKSVRSEKWNFLLRKQVNYSNYFQWKGGLRALAKLKMWPWNGRRKRTDHPARLYPLPTYNDIDTWDVQPTAVHRHCSQLKTKWK
jgi:hypothetical protein